MLRAGQHPTAVRTEDRDEGGGGQAVSGDEQRYLLSSGNVVLLRSYSQVDCCEDFERLRY